MKLLPWGAVLALTVWVIFTFVVPVGPAGTVIHLLLGLAGVLFVVWWAETR
jgi:hypothetical protein